MTLKGKCRNCGRTREVRPAERKGGGNYRRPNRWYRSSICEECATRLVALATPGQRTVSQWSILSLCQAFKLTRPSENPHRQDGA